MYSIMNMCTGKIEASSVASGDYDTEVLCAGLSPATTAMHQAHAQVAARVVERAARGTMPPELAAANLEEFLEGMYRSQG